MAEEYKKQECRICKGTGHINGTCKTCRGEGKVIVKEPAKECMQCRGTGYYMDIRPGGASDICPRCNGSGWQNTIYPQRG